MDIKDRLRAWRDKAGMSQEQAARVFFVSVATYQSWERGLRAPDGINVRNVEKVLGPVTP